MTLIREYNADETLNGDVHYNISLLSTVTVQKKTPCGDGISPIVKKGISPTSQEDNGIKTPCGEDDETLKIGQDGYLPSVEEDKKTPYGDGIITRDTDRDLQLTPIADQRDSVCTPWYGEPTTFNPKGRSKTLKGDIMVSVSTLVPDRRQGEEKLKNTK